MILIDYFAQAAQYINQGQFEAAEKSVDVGLAATPKHPGLQMLKGICLMKTDRPLAAEAYFRRAINALPDNAEFHNNYGVMLRSVRRLDEARNEFATAVRLNPRYKEALRSLAFLSWIRGDHDVAKSCFSRYGAIVPDDRVIAFHLSELMLGSGNLRDGWRLYQYRPNRPERSRMFRTSEVFYSVAPLPPSLDGELLTLLPEQGLGDVLFFLRYAPLLRRRNARIGYGAEKKIWRFVEDCGVVDQIFSEETILPHLGGAYTCFAGDLPFLSGEDTTMPPSVRIKPLPDRVETARKRLAEVGPPPYVGVNWRAGSQASAEDFLLFKSVPPKEIGEALRGVKGTILSLQRHPNPGELEEFQQALGRPVHDFSVVQADLEELMGFLAAIDEIVGVSSTSVHLRAAMGLNARVLYVSPTEWRWMLEGDESPWFPGSRVYRVNRDPLKGPAYERLNKELSEGLSSR